MSLDVTVYTVDESGLRHTVRGIDWKSLMEDWSARKPLDKEEHQRELRQIFKDHESWRTMAGPEAWRTEVYGSSEAEALGLTLLPTLAHANIDVQGAELERLGWEIEMLCDNVSLFLKIIPLVVAPAPESLSDNIAFRFRNLESIPKVLSLLGRRVGTRSKHRPASGSPDSFLASCPSG